MVAWAICRRGHGRRFVFSEGPAVFPAGKKICKTGCSESKEWSFPKSIWKIAASMLKNQTLQEWEAQILFRVEKHGRKKGRSFDGNRIERGLSLQDRSGGPVRHSQRFAAHLRSETGDRV